LRVPGIQARAARLAFFSALIFAAHPIQTQAVTYIIQRHETLSAFFSLFALLFFVLALRAAVRSKRVLLYAAVPICYILAFYSKEIAITLPAVILIFDLFFMGFKGKENYRKRWPLHAVMALLLIFFMAKSLSAMGGFVDLMEKRASISAPEEVSKAQPNQVDTPPKATDERARKLPSAGFAIEGLSPGNYLMTEFNVLTYYISLLAVPRFQNIDYDFPISNSLFETPQLKEGTRLIHAIPPPIVSLVIIIIILLVAFYLLWRSFRGQTVAGRGLIASFFILWFFIVLSPTSTIVPIIDVIFEHRLYLASLGFFVIIVLIVDWLSISVFARLVGERAPSE
ncbi:MAG: hypothetical protein V3V95_05180, partial [Thermodesulfobacteriota bacterium]